MRFDPLKQQAEQIKRHVNIVDVVRADLGGAIKAKGHEYHACCPFHEEKTPSFTVVPAKGYFHCFGCGAHGDAIEYYMRRMGVAFSEAVKALSNHYGLEQIKQNAIPRAAVIQDRQEDKTQAKKRAVDIYRSAVPALNSPVEEYLKARHIRTDLLAEGIFQQLRYAECDYYTQQGRGYQKLGTFPTMLAPLQNQEREITGVHMTYLAPDALSKADIKHPENGERLPAKKMRGVSFGSSIRLGKFSPVMAVSEGIENGLAFNSVYPDIPVWVAGSLGNMAGAGYGQGAAHPRFKNKKLPSVRFDHKKPGLVLPYGVKTLFLIVDNDMKDPESGKALVQRAAMKFRSKGVKVKMIVPELGCDLNDVLIKSGEKS